MVFFNVTIFHTQQRNYKKKLKSLSFFYDICLSFKQQSCNYDDEMRKTFLISSQIQVKKVHSISFLVFLLVLHSQYVFNFFSFFFYFFHSPTHKIHTMNDDEFVVIQSLSIFKLIISSSKCF